MSLWLRLYADLPNDPKVQLLEPAVFKSWVNLLCVAKQVDRKGVLPGLRDLAFLLRLEGKVMEMHLRELVDAGLVDEGEDGSLSMHGWSSRQYESDADRTASERKRRQREKVRESVTGDGSVTSRNVTRTETESESDTETEPDSDSESDTDPHPHPGAEADWRAEAGAEGGGGGRNGLSRVHVHDRPAAVGGMKLVSGCGHGGDSGRREWKSGGSARGAVFGRRF